LNGTRLPAALFFLSGLVGLIYELVWFRMLSVAFGQTSQALGTVLAVYLGGLAVGAWWTGMLVRKLAESSPRSCLSLYGGAEILIGVYALIVPWLAAATQLVLGKLYGTGHEGLVAGVRAALCAAILVPPTVLMGASLPLLAGYVGTHRRGSIRSLYTINLVGATIGALASGFALFPILGFASTLRLASMLSSCVGAVAIWTGTRTRETAPTKDVQPRTTTDTTLPTHAWIAAALVTGAACTLHEVVWGRVYGLLLGPTASTVALVLAVFLGGLALGGAAGRLLKHNLGAWLCMAQFASVTLLAWAYVAAEALPWRVAEWVRWHSQSANEIELMKAGVLAATLLPLATALGLNFPLLLRIAPAHALSLTSRIGGVYGISTAGCVAGAIATSWFLIPALGTQQTLLLAGLLSLALGILLFRELRPKARWVVWAPALAGAAVFAAPRWDMTALTAGGYKYAPYLVNSTESALTQARPLFLREGSSGTVAVRKENSSLVLAIDGKVDATDAGGDLLTEKLLAHLPLILARDARKVCLIGLASGVTAGSLLTHPIQKLDVVEISRDVVEASHFFDAVNGTPLSDPRTTLLVNDGRNHLALSTTQYDLIVSEPSNPWMAGMNSLFTLDFFRAAKRRLTADGVFAQWFHIYNMPEDDLRSVLRAFIEAFPSAMLWQLNDGDVLITGFFGPAPNLAAVALSPAAISDLGRVGVSDARLLLDMYVMRDDDIQRFAGSAQPNTDDNPILEFHGQRDLHAQTDLSNTDALTAFAKRLPPPAAVRAVRDEMTSRQLLSNGGMFERAESYHSAFRAYQAAFQADPTSVGAVAGMDRAARLPEEHATVALALGLPGGGDDLQQRTERALELARIGDIQKARFLFEENAQAHPSDASAHLNYGLFSLERSDYQRAIEQFQRALDLDPSFLPAQEAMAETYLRLRDAPNALLWSRRILALDPRHEAALRTVAALEASARTR
jgi:spermidine synthase